MSEPGIHPNGRPDIPWSSPGFPHTLNNEDLLAYIRHTSDDKEACNTLKQRWESFWDNDYRKLREFRFTIDRLIIDQTAERQRSAGLSQNVRKLREELEGYEDGRKIKALRATVRKLEKEVRKLTQERSRLKKMRPVPVQMAANEHALKCEIKELKQKVAQQAWTIMELRQFNAGGSFRITPPFTVFDHPHAHVKPTEVARMARIIHDMC